VQDTLQAGLALRDRRDAGGISDHGLATARGRLLAQLSRLIDNPSPLGRRRAPRRELGRRIPRRLPQQVLASVVRTARKHNVELPALFATMLPAPEPPVPDVFGPAATGGVDCSTATTALTRDRHAADCRAG